MGDLAIADIRYWMAVILITVLPVVTSFWFVIHGGIRFWKSRPAWMAYTVALIAILITLAVIIPNLRTIAGQDLGHSNLMLLLGAIIYLSSLRISSRIRSHLSFRTFAGIPEVQNESEALIESGPFKVVRHPRYFMIIVSTIGWVLMTNFVGAYLVGAAFFVCLYVIIKFEERELVMRFGDAYHQYRERVPMVMPKPGMIGRLFV